MTDPEGAREDFDRMLDLLSDGVVLTDSFGRIFKTNRAARHLCQIHPGDAQGRPFGRLFSPGAEVPGARLSARPDGPRTGGFRVGDRWFHVDSLRLPGSALAPEGTLLVLRPITARPAPEADGRLDRTLGELNNLLTVVLGDLSLRGEQASEEVQEASRLARDLTRELRELRGASATEPSPAQVTT